MFRGRVRSIHFVGIGGVGMSGIAEVLLAHGFDVTGSDLSEGEALRRLADLGARVHVGHRATHVQDADVVVASTAVAADNPELSAARERGIPVIGRAEMLAELMRLRDGIAIAGSHGKTTTTSLLATVLREAGLDPTVVIGGRLNALGSGATLGQGGLLVAEADESDGSFLHLSPVIAVITNVDPEHLDHHGSFDALKDAFVTFANRVPFYGLVVACLDHPHVQDMLPRIDKRVATYGTSNQADYCAYDVQVQGLQTSFELRVRGRSRGRFTVPMPGAHNADNALATLAVADELGVPLERACESLASFSGVQRRFTVLGEIDGVTVVDDYGHHPAEIEATLDAARRAYGRRVMVAFQPHRYTRTRDLFDELTRAFNHADVLLVTDVHAAGEAPIEGADSERLTAAIRAHGHRDVTHVPDRAQLAAELLKRSRSGDIVVTLGAGSITRTGPELIEALRARAADDDVVSQAPATES
jgi:UDP-N-acetylmuramate--alanine ligase